MGISRRLAALAAAFAGLLWAGPTSAQQVPVEAFGRLPAIADAAISPDGTKVALAQFEGDQSAITVIDLAQGRRVFASRMGDNQQLRGVGWADDQHVTFDMSVTFRPGEVLPPNYRFRGDVRRVDYRRRGAVNLTSGHIQFLTANSDTPWVDQGSAVIAPIEGDPGFGRILGVAQTQPDVQAPWIRQLYRINLDTGRAENLRVRGVTPRTIGILLDHNGNVVATADTRERDNRWRIFTYDGDTPRLLLEDVSDTGLPVDLGGLLPDGRLVIEDWDETQRKVFIAVDRATAARETIFRAEQGDVEGPILDPWTGRVMGAVAVGVQHFFDPELAAIATRVASRVSGDTRILTWSRDRQRFIVYAEVGLDGGGYYMFEPAANRLSLLSMCYPELQGRMRGAERQEITYAARDGVRIPAYLTLPPGMEHARNAPLVLLVHGGPASRDTLSFDWWSSFLASRGYLVLQPNFRGSTGYGQEWREAGRRQWGGLMQTDVEDGVAALVRAGMVDPARVCIVGASYGGYAALAGATLTPDRYACAVGVAGVYDLDAMLAREQATSGGDESSTSDYWTLSIGDRQTDRELIASVSPANLADRVHIPILLMHGTDDTVVPIQQTQLMERRLREAGKSVRFVQLTGDDHWLSDAPTRTSMLREIETFLAENLGPATPTAAPAAQ